MSAAKYSRKKDLSREHHGHKIITEQNLIGDASSEKQFRGVGQVDEAMMSINRNQEEASRLEYAAKRFESIGCGCGQDRYKMP